MLAKDKRVSECYICKIKDILCNRFDTIDYVQAKEDVLPFIKNPASLDVWDKDFLYNN